MLDADATDDGVGERLRAATDGVAVRDAPSDVVAVTDAVTDGVVLSDAPTEAVDVVLPFGDELGVTDPTAE